ncbi:glutathione S-transferase family protein [Corynebacterium timonense]|uniref:Putative glutathione S-transferase n=1 Tax=Corynebacterium timonense TaxID=441500 RepID=A0A1H1T3U9_9CORY|nr:glutathione S-transferase family protein [Corynebacterium timonense]SDS54696.1 putative glutathione S-transferase [Corynebacterium timonense]
MTEQDTQQQDPPEHARGGVYSSAGKSYERDTRYIGDRITRDARPVGEGIRTWPVEAGRYRLVVARACPWAHRAIIVRRLVGVEDAISMAVCGPVHDERSWTFDKGPGGIDPVLGYERLQQAYLARDPEYPRGITVPAIVEVESGAVVTNDFPWITLDFSTEWAPFHRDGAPDLYPEALRDEMDELMRYVYTEINNGVYRCGFAGTQESYDAAYVRLFAALDRISERLATRRYLMGDHITEADVRLYTTLVRFDAVYHGHFKCNRTTIRQMPVLWAYLRDLFQTPGFGDTTDFVDIKRHYYEVHRDLNPLGIVPQGPDLSGLLEPHGREELGGSPFGAGTAPAAEVIDPLEPGHSVGELIAAQAGKNGRLERPARH